jgi:hypothetical protein
MTLMTSGLRKFALTAHVTSSVGWLGAVAAFLVLAIAGQTSQDAQTVRSVYLAMNLTGWSVVVPLCIASLVTGLVMALGTKWGLFRHYWVTLKFLLTVISTLILFGFTNTLNVMGDLAGNASLSLEELRNLRQGPVGHSGVGLLVLVFVSGLSIYKPWGKTPYGLKQQNGKTMDLRSDSFSGSDKPWALYVFLGLAAVVIVFLVMHLASGGGH